MSEYVNPIDMLLDENNEDNIILFDDNDEETEFEQIAVIPYEDGLYCILRPVDMPELGEDEAFVFAIVEEDGEASIELVEDDELADRIFAVYYALLDEEDQ